MIPVKENKGLFRDEKTNSIINCDDLQYEQYMKMKSLKNKEKSELEELKSDINEIKSVLKILLEKINN
jgi:SPX domain protein involved in polyphosphate accumulation